MKHSNMKLPLSYSSITDTGNVHNSTNTCIHTKETEVIFFVAHRNVYAPGYFIHKMAWPQNIKCDTSALVII
jgi:hypothetical protein